MSTEFNHNHNINKTINVNQDDTKSETAEPTSNHHCHQIPVHQALSDE